jgi:hypothetical protein
MINSGKIKLKEYGKRIIFRYTSFGAPQYLYNIEPIQLARLVNEIERLKNVGGSICEIGVARGMTTRFLAEHLRQSGLAEQKIYAIDTFKSFLEADVDYEIKNRGKTKDSLIGFGYNDYRTWLNNFGEFSSVVPIKADCGAFDYKSIAPIKIALVDVDLYLPTRTALSRIFDNLVMEGVILVDDVKANEVYDGAYEAYMEFCSEYGIRPEVIGNKCGVIRKNG